MNFLITQASQVGSLVWVEDPDDAWVDGEVLEVIGEEVKINSTTGKTVSSFFPSVYMKFCIIFK